MCDNLFPLSMTIIDCSISENSNRQKTSMSQNNVQAHRKQDSSSSGIDWDRVSKGEKIGTGGFSTVYKAKYRHKVCKVFKKLGDPFRKLP